MYEHMPRAFYQALSQKADSWRYILVLACELYIMTKEQRTQFNQARCPTLPLQEAIQSTSVAFTDEEPIHRDRPYDQVLIRGMADSGDLMLRDDIRIIDVE
jgi:cbb3-type cytochrome oxidase subunit 3